MATEERQPWQENDYQQAQTLVKRLQETIDRQQQEIDRLKQRDTQLCAQTDSLRKQRDDLRVQNAQLTAEIANLSRRNSLSMLHSGLAMLQNRSGSPDRRPSAGTHPQLLQQSPTPPPPPALNRPLLPIPSQVDEEEEEDSSSDTDYEDTESPTPTLPKKVTLPTNSRRSYLATSASTLQSEVPDMTSVRCSSAMSTDSSAESSVEVFSTSPTPSKEEPSEQPKKHGLVKFNTLGSQRFQTPDEEFDDDNDGPLPMRQRLATVAVNSLGERSCRRVGGAGKKQTSHALRRQNSFPRRGQRIIVEDLTYLSPDMEMKIQEMMHKAIGKKYGGLERAVKAATCIQVAYREYKIRKRFIEIRRQQQDTMVRRRAFSVKYPRGRRPSMIGPKKYRRDVSAPSVDPMQRVQAAHKQITSRSMGISPHISRRDVLIRNNSLSDSPLVDEPFPALTISEAADEAMPDSARLPCSLSSDALSTPHIEKSPSIFSGLSLQNMEEIFPMEVGHRPGTPQQESASTLKRKTNIGINIFNKKPTKGIQYLVYQGVLEDHPQAVAKFLHTQYGLSKEKIGEFVGEIRYDFNIAVLECLVELIDLSGKTIDGALRHFQQLFRMPGEAQKIDKIMQVFAGEYYRHNECGIINSEDAAYVLAFATMMVHTDLHNPAVRRHMTKTDWLRMNRGTNDDEDYPEDFLLAIYDRVSKLEFTTGVDHTKEVNDIQRSIVGASCPRLINPQRQFLHKLEVSEVMNINKKPLVSRHRRMLFIFNDVFLVTKPIGGRNPTYDFKRAWSLLNAQVLEFSTSAFKFGVCVQRTFDGQKYQCNCDCEEDRKLLCKYLNDAIEELTEMERERILELGSTLKSKASFPDLKEKRGNRDSVAGDLLSTITMSASVQDMRSVGASVQDAWCVSTASTEVDIKRSSKDSGFDSPHATSPAPNVPIAQSTPPGKRRNRPVTPDKRSMLVVPSSASSEDPRKIRSRSLTPTGKNPPPSSSMSNSKTLPPPDSKKKGWKTRFSVSSGSGENSSSSNLTKKSKTSRTKSTSS